MNIAVVYQSTTGNTKKVAEAMAGALGADVVPVPLEEAPPLDEYDLVFVGMPIERFGAPKAARTFLEDCCSGRRVALFVTHAAGEDMPEVESWLGDCRQAAEGCELVGLFHCRGQLAEPVRQWMANSGMPDMVEFAELSAEADGQPDGTRLAAAADFARQTVDGILEK